MKPYQHQVAEAEARRQRLLLEAATERLLKSRSWKTEGRALLIAALLVMIGK